MLKLTHLFKSFGQHPILRDISFTLPGGQTLVLLGPSGSGKSTLLRLIAGLETPDSGRILWQNTDLAAVPAHARRFGLVFQDYALFPHLNVAQNVAYGLRMQGWAAEDIPRRVKQTLQQVSLAGFETRTISKLSGGEQQRVALARALAWQPRLLMLDEPLGALDRALRSQLLDELRAILRRSGIPALYVTHDQEEAFALADRVLILHKGEILQNATPQTLFHAPASPWVADFLGLGTLIEGEMRSDGSVLTQLGIFRPQKAAHVPRRGAVTLLLRPESAHLPAGHERENIVHGQVSDCVFLPSGQYRLRLHNGVTAILPQPQPPAAQVKIAFAKIQVFPASFANNKKAN